MNTQSKTLAAAISLFVMGAIPGVSLASNADEIQSRVQKIGKLSISGGAAAPAAAANTAAVDSNDASTSEAPASSSGTEAAADPVALYQASCFACHGTGAAGAPVLGNKEAWAPRIAKGENVLNDSAINGLNAMPPRGGSILTDDQIKAVVAHMVSSSQ